MNIIEMLSKIFGDDCLGRILIMDKDEVIESGNTKDAYKLGFVEGYQKSLKDEQVAIQSDLDLLKAEREKAKQIIP